MAAAQHLLTGLGVFSPLSQVPSGPKTHEKLKRKRYKCSLLQYCALSARLEPGRLFLSCVGSQHPVFRLERVANKAPYVPLCIIKL